MDNDIRVVLVGKTGCGKSSLGNILLQEKKFQVGLSGSSVTDGCRDGERTLQDGRRLVVVDTPPLTTANINNKVIQQCLDLSKPGPHVFLLVIRIGRFTQEALQAIDNFRDLFGEQVLRFVLIVFTERDTLDFDEETIENYLKDVPDKLQQILSDCHFRYVAINNRSKDPSEGDGVMKKVKEMIYDHEGEFYTDGMFLEAMRKREMRRPQTAPSRRTPETHQERRERDHLISNRFDQMGKRRIRLILIIVAVVVLALIVLILALTLG